MRIADEHQDRCDEEPPVLGDDVDDIAPKVHDLLSHGDAEGTFTTDDHICDADKLEIKGDFIYRVPTTTTSTILSFGLCLASCTS